MRGFKTQYMLLLSFLILVVACSKEKNLEEVLYEIPEEDRFVFSVDDTLLYPCSNGSIDTVFVKDIDFKTETGTYTIWGSAMHNYITETQSLFLETAHDNWKYEDLDSRCFRINTLPKYDNINVAKFPWCDLLNGCEYTGSRVIAENLADYDEKIFNDISYKKVYYIFKGDVNNGFEIYWNLKYGIIRFVGNSNGNRLIWQLKD